MSLRIGQREVGPGHPVYVIAELGVNHDGSADRAVAMVDAAAAAGADAVKLQMFQAEMLMSRACRLAQYQAAAGETDPIEMLRRLQLPLEGMGRVVERAHSLGLHAIVTVFSVELVAQAETLGWDGYKTASPDVINRPLLDALARTGRPLIVSTGAATLDEVRRAVGWLTESGAAHRLGLLQCVSSYPAPDEEAAVGGMIGLAHLLDGPVGYSDHTVGEDTGALAATWGAAILEKHVTHDRTAAGPDHRASLDEAGFTRYVAAVRAAAPVAGHPQRHRLAMKFGREADVRVGSCSKELQAVERDVRTVSRQSLTLKRALPAGHVLCAEDLTVKRPGTGIEPFRLDEMVGRRLARCVEGDMPLMMDDVA